MISPITELHDWHIAEDQTFEWPVYAANNKDLEAIFGWTIEFRMAKTRRGTAVITKTASLDDPENGLCSVLAAQADSASLAPGNYYYYLSRIDSGFNQVLAEGPVKLLPRIA
jgi:hypothetical protein